MKNYKLKCKLFLLFISIIASVQSQNFSYGVYLGSDITNLYLYPVPDGNKSAMFSPVLSYNFNGFVSYKTGFFLGFSIEPGIIRYGGVQLFDHLNSKYQPVTNQVKATINCLQIPVLIDFHLNDKLCISAGVDMDYTLSMKSIQTDDATTMHFLAGEFPLYATFGTGPNTIADNIVPDSKYHFRYYSGIIGLQYKLNKRFGVCLRYGFSLNKIYGFNWEIISNDGLMEMENSNIYSAYYQLGCKIRL